MYTKIYFIRHAHSSYINGFEKERGLSEEGKKAAACLVDVFKSIDIKAIYSSDYKRAIKTVEPIANEKTIEIGQYPQLRERLLKPEEVVLPYDDFIHAIKKSHEDHKFSLEGGESIEEVQKRTIPFIHQIMDKHKGKNIIIASHGNVMTMIMKYYDSNYGYEFWKETTMPDIYIMTFKDASFVDIKKIAIGAYQIYEG